MNQSLFETLTSNPAESESLTINSLIQDIERLRAQSEGLSSEEWEQGLKILSPYRLRSSGTLKSGDVQGWITANSYVSQKLIEEKTLQPEDIFAINSYITGSEKVSLRTTDIFIGPQKACLPNELPELLKYFYDNILPLEKHAHPLIAASLIRYWLVSLHPFNDGNGRTSVMICDWILLAANYLPLTFERQTDAVIGTFHNGRSSATVGQAIIKNLKSVLLSYKIVLGIEVP
ncbi:MAG: Fic family protein [Bdellovibrio sp.]